MNFFFLGCQKATGRGAIGVWLVLIRVFSVKGKGEKSETLGLFVIVMKQKIFVGRGDQG